MCTAHGDRLAGAGEGYTNELKDLHAASSSPPPTLLLQYLDLEIQQGAYMPPVQRYK